MYLDDFLCWASLNTANQRCAAYKSTDYRIIFSTWGLHGLSLKKIHKHTHTYIYKHTLRHSINLNWKNKQELKAIDLKSIKAHLWRPDLTTKAHSSSEMYLVSTMRDENMRWHLCYLKSHLNIIGISFICEDASAVRALD